MPAPPPGSRDRRRARSDDGQRACAHSGRGEHTDRAARRAAATGTTTLQHPRCVFQMLKRHFARYTPEMVEQICGVPQDTFLQVCELLAENSGRSGLQRSSYAVGWTQHTVGAQYIRTASILQCCSATSAVRAAASWRCAATPPSRARPTSRRCSICCRATCRCRTRRAPGPGRFIEAETTDKGFWANMRAYAVSLLKA